ncbi:hypothetical protein CRYUN_Cryun33cG0026500 [Craigia yunnanensis]
MVIDGNSRGLSTYHPQHPGVSSLGNNLLSGASSSGQSRGPWSSPRFHGIPYGTDCVGESSQVCNPALGAALSIRDLTDSTGLIQRAGHTQLYQSNKIKMNKDSAPLVKESEINATPVSRLSKQKEQIAQPPKEPTSLIKRSGTSTIPESKQLTLKGTIQPLKDPAEYAKKSAISRIRTSMLFMKKMETIQPLKNPPDLVKNGGTSTILASKHVMQKKETTQPPKDPAGLVKNIGTSRIPASMHSMQKKKTIQSPKVSAVWVKKSETTSRITQKKENTQPSEGSAGLVSNSGTGRTLASKLVTLEKETVPAKPRQEQHFCEEHIMWEGFDQRIVPLEKSCLLCDGDLANEPEYDPDIERVNPAENAVLSCGHVFHSLCLLFSTSEEKSIDPPCIICASILS